MDNKPTFNDSCEAMASHFGIYSIKEASALWCNVKKENLKEVVSQMTAIADHGVGRSIYKHPFISCVEPISQTIATAMESGALSYGREDGIPVDNYAAYERRHTRGTDLKKWLLKEGINEKPAFLFDDLERDTHTSISADAYRVVIAERDAQNIRLKNAETEYRKLQSANKELTKRVGSGGDFSETSKRNYELIIGLLTKALADKSGPNGGNKDKPNYSGLSDLLQQYLPADGLGAPSNKSLSSENLRKKLAVAFNLLENN